jgi:hypothetical protein
VVSLFENGAGPGKKSNLGKEFEARSKGIEGSELTFRTLPLNGGGDGPIDLPLLCLYVVDSTVLIYVLLDPISGRHLFSLGGQGRPMKNLAIKFDRTYKFLAYGGHFYRGFEIQDPEKKKNINLAYVDLVGLVVAGVQNMRTERSAGAAAFLVELTTARARITLRKASYHYLVSDTYHLVS